MIGFPGRANSASFLVIPELSVKRCERLTFWPNSVKTPTWVSITCSGRSIAEAVNGVQRADNIKKIRGRSLVLLRPEGCLGAWIMLGGGDSRDRMALGWGWECVGV